MSRDFMLKITNCLQSYRPAFGLNLLIPFPGPILMNLIGLHTPDVSAFADAFFYSQQQPTTITSGLKPTLVTDLFHRIYRTAFADFASQLFPDTSANQLHFNFSFVDFPFRLTCGIDWADCLANVMPCRIVLAIGLCTVMTSGQSISTLNFPPVVGDRRRRCACARWSIEHAGQVNFTRGKLNFVRQPWLPDRATDRGTINVGREVWRAYYESFCSRFLWYSTRIVRSKGGQRQVRCSLSLMPKTGRIFSHFLGKCTATWLL